MKKSSKTSNYILRFLDHGLEVITNHISQTGIRNNNTINCVFLLTKYAYSKTEFPWLMSNVVDNETGRPLGSGKSTHVILHNGIKIGIIGLVEKEWLDTLPTIDPKEASYFCLQFVFSSFSVHSHIIMIWRISLVKIAIAIRIILATIFSSL